MMQYSAPTDLRRDPKPHVIRVKLGPLVRRKPRIDRGAPRPNWNQGLPTTVSGQGGISWSRPEEVASKARAFQLVPPLRLVTPLGRCRRRWANANAFARLWPDVTENRRPINPVGVGF